MVEIVNERSILGNLAAQGLTAALMLAMKASPVSIVSICAGMQLTAIALAELSTILEDGKISEEEIEGVLTRIGASGDNAVLAAIASAINRIIGQIL